MSNDTMTQPTTPPSEPHPSLRQLDALVGTWQVSGPEVSGQVSFRWLDGGFFLAQDVDMVQGGATIKGLEIIGHDEESDALASHYFDNAGNHFTYAWELEGDRLTIWFGPAGSPGVFRGTFAGDRNSLSGAWTWPGGGYESTMTRVA